MKLGNVFADKFQEIANKSKWSPFRKTMRLELLTTLDGIASEMTLKWREDDELRIDRAYYNRDSVRPTIAVKQESVRRDWESDIRRLLRANARLSILICFLTEQEQNELRGEIVNKLDTEMRVGRFSDEFMLISGNSSTQSKDMNFVIYSYFPKIFEKKIIYDIP